MIRYFTHVAMLSLYAILFLSYSVQSYAQTASPSQTSISLLGESASQISIHFEPGSMVQKKVVTSMGEAVIISTGQSTPMLQKGYPDLPKITTSIIIPDDKNMEVTVTSATYTDYENVLVAPSKGSLLRDVSPADIPFVFGEAYQENNFFPKQIAALREPYILRDFRGQTVIVYPFQYNPVTKTLRVYSAITVAVSANNDPAANVLKRNPEIDGKMNAAFNPLYQHQFINYPTDLRYDQLQEEGNMLIISYGPFMNAMQPLADWKIQRGLRTEIVDVGSIGNDKTAIKNYVANYYNTKGLTYLLLVGDATQVATSSTVAGDSDNDYGYISGNDHYQEIFVGRFSAETETEVTTQVSKTISYEKTPVSNGYFSKAVCIASNEGAGIGDDGEADYEHQDLIRTELLAYNYTDVAELFDGTHGNTDAPGNPVANDLTTLINNGSGLISYTGHGSGSSLSTTDFNTTDANNLTNITQWPFMWVVGCSVGNFTGSTCLAESFARSSHNGQPAGAVASFMSTILQAWAEPMEAQDEMHLLLTESYADNIKRTFGGLSINGCFSMNDKYGTTGFNMTDTWALFGDPSLEVRTAIPSVIAATHGPSIELGSTHFTISSDADNSLAALTVNGIIIATATVSGGAAELVFDPLTVEDTLVLTITGYNKEPYIALIPSIHPAGTFVSTTSIGINDSAGNGNGLADFNEDLKLNVTLHNFGLSDASGVIATMVTTDPYITLTDPQASYNTITTSASVLQNNAFSFAVGDNVPDGHLALFNCITTDNTGISWNTPFSIPVNAPVPVVSNFMISDAAGGNGDGFPDPLETVTVTVTASNHGHSAISNAAVVLSTGNTFITIPNPSFFIGEMMPGEDHTASFEISVAVNAVFGMDVNFTAALTAGSYTGSLDFTTVISPALENFETNDFSQYPWQLSGVTNWFTTSSYAYEGSYCAQSGNVNDFESSALEVMLDVQFDDDLSFAHKVSSEPGYDFLKFYID
ncbi:MAG TPA: C25 family cysteine peptidase, partial [Chitinophagales bacterium]|nr:C25 family cysteine peptidase [Chitinophagales bacterium]